MRLGLTRNGQFHPIHNFSHLLPPKHLIFGEISKIFVPGGVHWLIFWVFQLFWIVSHWSSSKWPTMANFATKVARISSKWAILVKFQQKLKYLSGILTDLHRTFRTGLDFLSPSKWAQGVLCYDQKWWKLKYLSRILTDLHRTFRTGLVFLSWSKWVQAVVCYDQNWQKLKYLSGISTDLHQTFRTGLIFLSQSKWVQGVLCYNQNWWKL